MAHGGDDLVGDEGILVGLDGDDRIEADGAVAVGGIEIDDLMGAARGHEGEDGSGKVAVWIDDADATIAGEILHDHIEQ